MCFSLLEFNYRDWDTLMISFATSGGMLRASLTFFCHLRTRQRMEGLPFHLGNHFFKVGPLQGLHERLRERLVMFGGVPGVVKMARTIPIPSPHRRRWPSRFPF